MRRILENIKTIIAELAGIIGGFFWGRATNWEYEPLILIIISVLGLIISVYLLITAKNENLQPINITIKNNDKQDSGNSRNNYTKESPETIKQKISSAPLYQKTDIAKNFVGLNVEWHLRLFYIHKNRDSKIIVIMRPISVAYINIRFEVNIEDYPIFKISEEDKEFIITGKIIECEIYEITLQLSNLAEK